MRDGLPSNNIIDLLRDSRGFYWVATDAGLVRWYGNEFEVFGAGQGLPGAVVQALAEDNDGNLWIALQGEGIIKYDGRNFETAVPAASFSGSRINRIQYSPAHDILLVTLDNGFAVYGNDSLEIIYAEPQLYADRYINITGFLETDSFIYVQSYNNGLFRYFPERGTVTPASPIDSQLHTTISARVTEAGDTIWGLATRNIYISGKQRQEMITGIAEVHDFAEDQNGNVLLASVAGPFSDDGGIFRLGDQGPESLNEIYGLEANEIKRVIFDPSDRVIVIADMTKGIFVLYPPLISKGYRGLDPEGMNIGSIAETGDGSFWIADDKNVFTKKPGSGGFERFDTGLLKNELQKFMNEEFPAKYSFYLDPDGSWEKYQNLKESGQYPYPNPYQRLHNCDTIIFNDRILHRREEYEYLRSRSVESINHLSAGADSSLWINTNVGFFKIKGNRVEKYLDHFSTTRTLFDVADYDKIVVYGLGQVYLVDPSGREPSQHFFIPQDQASIAGLLNTGDRFWVICRNSGLYLFDGSSFRHMNREDEALASSLTAITSDKRGNLIAGTAGGMIQVLSFENDNIKILHTIEPSGSIIGSRINWLETDNSDMLWAGTNLGVNLVNLDSLYVNNRSSFRFFDTEEGLTEPGVRASLVDREGNLWLGAPGMLAKIDSKAVSDLEAAKREIFLKQIDLDYAPTDWHGLEGTDSWMGLPPEGVRLKYYNNNLSFFWDVNNITGNEKTFFRYRVLGLNDSWSPFDNTRQAIFPNIPPGRYLLEVEAQLSFDEPSRSKTEFSFRIMPPWWQTWWFYTVSGILLLTAFWVVLIVRVRKIRKEEVRKLTQEREINELRIKALQAQMNPHFTFNALNSIQYFLANADQENAFRFIGYFAKLIRQTLEFASRSSVSIKEEASFLENYIKLEQMRFEDKFRFKIAIDPPNLDSHRYQIPPMLLQPFVENAILHGLLHKETPGMLLIRFEPTGKEILGCVVEDDGIGREKSAEINRGRHKSHKSLGLDITKRRIGLLNQPGQQDFNVEISDLHGDDGKPSGTRIFIKIPINEINMEEDYEEWN